MTILSFVEQRNGVLRKSSRQAVSLAKEISMKRHDKLIALLVGEDISSLSEDVKTYGPDEIWLCQDQALSKYQPESYAAVLSEVIKSSEADLVLLSHTAMGKDLGARVAERLDAGLVSDCVGLETDEDGFHFIKPFYAGKVLSKIKILTPLKMVSVRPNSFSIVENESNSVVKDFSITLPKDRAVVTSLDIQDSGRPELIEAENVVSGGRGLGTEEGFELIEKLADELDAAVGASRAAVDAGWKPHHHQVGQTGKVVSPNLYVACGISGAIQHMAGMGTSKYIVAINKDPEANIMKTADLAIEGDLYEIIPALVDEIKKRKTT